jgi:hypothetical protein
MQKVNLLRLMPGCVGLIMLAAYLFLSILLSQVEKNCSLIKVDWLGACIALRVTGAVFFVFLRRYQSLV